MEKRCIKWHTIGVEGITVAEGITGAEGGDLVLPLLALGVMGAGGAMKGFYDISKAYEQRKYLDDYRRWTGYSPRYPWRSGSYDYLRAIGGYSANAGLTYGGMYNYYNRS